MHPSNWAIPNKFLILSEFFFLLFLFQFASSSEPVTPTEKPKSENCRIYWKIKCNDEKTLCHDPLFDNKNMENKFKPSKRFQLTEKYCEIKDGFGQNSDFELNELANNINVDEGPFLADFIKKWPPKVKGKEYSFCRQIRPNVQQMENSTSKGILPVEQTPIITSSTTTTPETTTTPTTTSTTTPTTTTMTPYPPYRGKRESQILHAKDLDLVAIAKSKKEKLQNGMAAILTAQPGENWHDISITLYRNDTNDEQFLVQFVVLNWVHKMQLSYLKKVGEKFEMIVEEKDDAEHFFDQHKEFVLMFNLRQANMDIIINENTFNWSFPMDENNRPDSDNRKFVNPEVGTIKIDADIFIKKKMKAIYATGAVIRMPCNLYHKEESDTVKGKVFKQAKWFEIRFFVNWHRVAFEKECLDAKDTSCMAPVFVRVDFEKGKTLIGGYGGGFDGTKIRKEMPSNNTAYFTKDGNFQITLNYDFFYERPRKFTITYGNGKEDFLVEEYMNAFVEYVMIFGDAYLSEITGLDTRNKQCFAPD